MSQVLMKLDIFGLILSDTVRLIGNFSLFFPNSPLKEENN